MKRPLTNIGQSVYMTERDWDELDVDIVNLNQESDCGCGWEWRFEEDEYFLTFHCTIAYALENEYARDILGIRLDQLRDMHIFAIPEARYRMPIFLVDLIRRLKIEAGNDARKEIREAYELYEKALER